MWFDSAKRIILAGGTALVLGGSAIGLVSAQQTPTPTPRPPVQTVPGQATPGQQARPGHQVYLEALARRLGITTDRLQQAMTEARNEVGIPERRPGEPGRAFGRGGFDLSVAAQAMGITVDQLRQELPGRSLAQVAQLHGRSPVDVANALKNAANQRIDQAVAGGQLTAAQAAERKAQIAQMIDQRMNEVRAQGGLGLPPGGFPGGAPSGVPGAPGVPPVATPRI